MPDDAARPPTALRNLGPKSARALTEVGVTSEADLRALGAVAAYRRVKHADPRGTSLNMLYALHGALTDTPWQALPEAEKADLRRAAGV